MTVGNAKLLLMSDTVVAKIKVNYQIKLYRQCNQDS